jgi:hypothetical protein
MTNVTTYSLDGNVSEKFANITIPPDIIVYNFRLDAYNRINAKLRKIYVVPIVSTDATDIGILKSIESNLASGNILLAVATLHEVENVHEYGKLLIAKAEKELDELVNEEMVLSSGVTRDADDSDEVIDPPILQGGAADDYSTFDRPMSGIANDAIEGKVDAEAYNELEDTKTI